MHWESFNSPIYFGSGEKENLGFWSSGLNVFLQKKKKNYVLAGEGRKYYM